MSIKRIVPLLLAAFALAGCTNLKEVGDYAGESAKLSANTELTTRFRDTYSREQPYLFGEPDRLAQANDKRRKAAYEDLLKIHRAVTFYMQTLATLAGEDGFDLSKNIDSLSDGIKSYPDLGIDEKHVDAVSKISRLITKSYQERAVREMIKEGDAPLQVMLEGMAALVRYYKATHENEKKTVLGFLEVEIQYVDDPKDRLLAALARAHAQSKELEYKRAQQKYIDSENGIRRIAEGHRKLLENIDGLAESDVKSTIGGFAKDIKSIRENL